MEKQDEAGGLQLLSREQIMATNDLPFEVVDVPEWGGKVRVKALSGKERDAFEASLVVKRKERSGRGTKETSDVSTQNIRAKLCALTIVDSAGGRLFGDDMVVALGEKSAAALDRVYSVAARLSKISDDDVEELAKNS